MSVLVVDDASIMRIVLKDILVRYCEYEKEEILEAIGGNHAISLYKMHNPELVLLDIGMPDISGADVVKAIMQYDPDAKIIMCTASKDKGNVVDCVRAGAKDYIIKPPEPKRVRQAISKITGKVFEEIEEVEEAEEGSEV